MEHSSFNLSVCACVYVRASVCAFVWVRDGSVCARVCMCLCKCEAVVFEMCSSKIGMQHIILF